MLRILRMLVFPVTFFTLLGGCRGAAPGLEQGRLAPCPQTPNCVSTRSSDAVHGIEPYPYCGGREASRARLLEVIAGLPRTRIITAGDLYIHAEFRSRIWRFVDDVEFLFDDSTGTIQFRSASRLGKSDLGVNRRRMEQIRGLYLQE